MEIQTFKAARFTELHKNKYYLRIQVQTSLIN